ncbi:MAG: glutamate racemase [Henriciella sp.]
MTQQSVAMSGHVLIFDSGVGGLTIANEVRALAPDLSVDYAADTAFFPYGDKSDDALGSRLPDIAEALVEQASPDVFVIACNTASTLALEHVRARLDIPVVGTVPAIKPAVALSRSGTIGLLATPGTIRREYTAQLIADFAADHKVIMHGSTDLVQLAERHAVGDPVAMQEFREAQRPLFDQAGADQIDTIVLACTHFPLIRGELAATVPHPVQFVDSGEAIARQTVRSLTGAASRRKDGGRVFVTGGDVQSSRLARICGRFGFDRLCRI